MRVAMLQLSVVPGEVEQNLNRALEMIEEAADQADVVVLPEVWTTGYALRNIAERAEEISGPTIRRIQAAAKDQQVNIIAGSVPLRQDNKIYNAAVVINDCGAIVAGYNKIHMFSLFNEGRFFEQGKKLSVFDLAHIPSGLAICYDLRFPEMFRRMALDGVSIIYLPAEWPTARGENWRVLNQARAIENQVYMCAVNCVGEFKGSPFYGHSLFIAPDGTILAEGTSNEEILYGEVDDNYLAKVRKNMSVMQDRRPELYAL